MTCLHPRSLLLAGCLLLAGRPVPVGGDLIHLTDGRCLHGSMGEERGDEVQICLKHGSVWLKRVEVARIETVADLKAEYARQRATLGPKDAAAHFALAGWCVVRDLEEESQAEWEATIGADPDHVGARKALRHVQVKGVWMSLDEARFQQGLVEREGEWVTPLRARLMALIDHHRVADEGGRDLIAKDLRRLGEEGARELESWLREKTDLLREGLGGGDPQRSLRSLRDQFRERRAALQSLVEDKERYPDDHASPEVMDRVAELHRQVTRLSEDPLSCLLTEPPERVLLLERISSASTLGPEVLPATSQAPMLFAEVIEPLRRAVTPEAVTGGDDLNPFSAENEKTAAVNLETAKDMKMEADDRAIIDELNATRRRMGLRVLRLDASLTEAARRHSAEMDRLEYFSHVSPTPANRTLELRIRTAGFKGDLIGENIAQGSFTPSEIMEAWRRSPGHHRNLLRASFSAVGAARAGSYWTLDFGGWEKKP